MTQNSTDVATSARAVFTDWREYAPGQHLPDVLDAAVELFVLYGYHGTSIRAIAARAGMTVPGLYYHFKSKQEMLVTLLRISNDEVMRRGIAALEDAGDSPRDRFIALVENIVLYMTNRRHMAHLAHEIRGLEEPYRTQHIELRDELEAMVLSEIIAARALGMFDTEHAHEATRAVLVLCKGVADWYQISGVKSPSEVATRYVGFALSLVQDKRTL